MVAKEAKINEETAKLINEAREEADELTKGERAMRMQREIEEIRQMNQQHGVQVQASPAKHLIIENAEEKRIEQFKREEELRRQREQEEEEKELMLEKQLEQVERPQSSMMKPPKPTPKGKKIDSNQAIEARNRKIQKAQDQDRVQLDRMLMEREDKLSMQYEIAMHQRKFA